MAAGSSQAPLIGGQDIVASLDLHFAAICFNGSTLLKEGM